MAQDFAKQRQAPSQNRKATRVPQRPAKRAHWGWYFSGMASGALVAVFAYFGFARYQALMQETPAAVAEAIAEAQEEMPAFDFGFYDELATAEVNVNVASPVATETPAAATPAAASPPAATAEAQNVSYLLQAGSFQDRQDAEERRAKIILLNMDAQISAGVVSGRTWYRVQVGPFINRGNAEQARNLLSASNIDSIPLLMR